MTRMHTLVLMSAGLAAVLTSSASPPVGVIGFNESGEPASDVTVIFAPVGLPFRSELEAPGPYCPF
jgi:hypothetical protein